VRANVKTSQDREDVLAELRALDSRMKQTLASLVPEVTRHAAGSMGLGHTERFVIRRRLIRRMREISCAWADGVEAAVSVRRKFTSRLRRWLG
jgi:hypothetical protein